MSEANSSGWGALRRRYPHPLKLACARFRWPPHKGEAEWECASLMLVHEQQRWMFEQRFDALDELGGVVAVDDAVVEG
jgi:hypothetical protein